MNTICNYFTLYSIDSFENVRSKWYPEVQHHCPDIPVILVGTKKDLRDAIENKRNSDELNSRPKNGFGSRGDTLKKRRMLKKSKSRDSILSFESAQSMQSIYEETASTLVNELYNVVKYVECSSKTGEGVKEVFEEAIRAVINPKVEKEVTTSRCAIF